MTNDRGSVPFRDCCPTAVNCEHLAECPAEIEYRRVQEEIRRELYEAARGCKP